MPNWCSTAYAIEGNAKEVNKLYELMKGLEERKEPSVESDFGTSWLGCLVDALGENWKEVSCRGKWYGLEIKEGTLYLETVTAWSPCYATFELVREKFPSLRYYYQSEEPGMEIFETNDRESKYFPDKYYVNVYTNEKECDSEYFPTLSKVYEWIGVIAGQPIKSQEDVDHLVEQWQKVNKYAYCDIHNYMIVA